MAMRPRTFGGANNSTRSRLRGAAAPPVYEDFKPKSEWIQDQESDNLLIYLPGFTKESLKVSTEGTNTIKVRGERLVTGNKWQRFQEDFHAPDYCNLKGTHARFEGGILTIIVPKNILTPPKDESKPIDKATTSQIPPEILPAKPPHVPKDSFTQNVQETIPPKSTDLKQEDKEKVYQESNVPPKPISSVPSKVPEDPTSRKVEENIPPKTTPPNKNDKAKAFQESSVSSNPISPVSDDNRKYDHTLTQREKLPKTRCVEQKKKVDSEASKHQETTSETKAEHGHSEMEKNKRIHELMDAEENVKRRKIMDGENNAAKSEFVEKNIQETERNKASKTGFVDEDKLRSRNQTATSSGTGHFGLGNFKKAVKSLAELDEERKLLVNMGAAVIVFMALGAYIYHTVKN